MTRFWFLLLLAALGFVACVPSGAPAAATPTPALATIPASLPTTLAAYGLPDAATATAHPSPTPQPRAPYPAPGATLWVAQLPPAPIIGIHRVQPGETIFCIGRAYGVLPGAIAQANGLSQTFSLAPGQALNIPAVQWTGIPDGPICAPQFQSPFPGLIASTPTRAAYPNEWMEFTAVGTAVKFTGLSNPAMHNQAKVVLDVNKG